MLKGQHEDEDDDNDNDNDDDDDAKTQKYTRVISLRVLRHGGTNSSTEIKHSQA